ncbi:MAG: 2OG-Fe(II) oxygenase [Zetaproteobacteria bacterium]|nr:2OG-Fe(II) oxygenase [Zetaproteobacteria bacterium]
MLQKQPFEPTFDDKFATIVHDLCTQGFSIYDHFLSPLIIHNLAHEARSLHENGAFRHARIGHGRSLQLRPEVRNDQILWLDTENPSAIQVPYFQDLETLRHAINRNLFMGLFEFEGHFAIYPPGARYQMHYDRFVGTMERLVTTILYLNDHWQECDGGALSIHAGNTQTDLRLPMDILPIAGRLVTFISGDFPHEVQPASRDRISLTGWFRARP